MNGINQTNLNQTVLALVVATARSAKGQMMNRHKIERAIETGKQIALNAMRAAWKDCKQCAVAQALTCQPCRNRYVALLKKAREKGGE